MILIHSINHFTYHLLETCFVSNFAGWKMIAKYLLSNTFSPGYLYFLQNLYTSWLQRSHNLMSLYIAKDMIYYDFNKSVENSFAKNPGNSLCSIWYSTILLAWKNYVRIPDLHDLTALHMFFCPPFREFPSCN